MTNSFFFIHRLQKNIKPLGNYAFILENGTVANRKYIKFQYLDEFETG
jgi:hypothetical protein